MRDREQDFIVSRLKNQTGAGEGANVPPAMKGGYRIPFVTGIKLLEKTTSAAGIMVTIGWDEPTDYNNIRCYNVYAYGILGNDQPVGPYSTTRSPCHVLLQSPTDTTVVFKVQTILNNGFSTPIDTAPSCAISVAAFT